MSEKCLAQFPNSIVPLTVGNQKDIRLTVTLDGSKSSQLRSWNYMGPFCILAKKKLTLMTGSSKYSCQLILCRSSNLALLYCTYTVCALWEKDFHLRRSRPRLSSRPIRELSAALKGDDRSWSDWPLEKHTETPPAESVYLMLTIYSLVPKHAVLACPAIIIWFLLTFKLKGEHSWAFEVILNVFVYSKEMYFHW